MITGCPTAMSAAETRLLQRIADGKRVVEAGALLGYSTIQLAKVADSVVSIDRHDGYSGDNYARYRSNLVRAGVKQKVAVVRADVLEALPHLIGDVGFIDLTGQFALTRDAMRAMRPDVVMVHDAGRAHCQVDAAVKAAGFRVVEAVDTLVVCERVAA